MTRALCRAVACVLPVWMALVSGVLAQVVINEVRCRAGESSVRTGEDPARLEFVELYNPGATMVDLSGWEIAGAALVSFPPGTLLGPGEYLVAARDPEYLKARGPAVPAGVPVLEWAGGVPAEHIRLLAASRPAGRAVDEAACSDGGPSPSGEITRGRSLELVHPKLHGSSPRAWRPSMGPNGTPGARNSRFTEAPILMEEKPERRMSALGLTHVSVTFSEAVTGVRASDLRVDGKPAVSVEGSDAGPYLFRVDPPRSMRVPVVLAGAIQNRDGIAFAGDSWEYVNNQSAVLSLPDDASGGKGTAIQVPLSAVPGDGILGIDMTLRYDPSVILATNVTTSGIAASEGFALIRNLNTPGVIVISMYATQSPMTGSGEIAKVQFSVAGDPGAASSLTFSYASINENAIPAVLDNGLFTVNCAGAANGTSCNDGNSCTDGDQCVGGICAGTPLPTPDEVGNAHMDADGMSFVWDPVPGAGPGTSYDVVRGDPGALPVGPGGSDEVCFAESVAVTSVADAAIPPAGGAFWYLVRGKNACGKGTYGFQGQGGVPTVPRNTATCP